jgi:putative hemolysin
MKWLFTLTVILIALTSCTTPLTQPTPDSVPTDIPQADMPNPASAHCVEQGFRSEIRTIADGSQTGVCIFPDGSECDEWAYYRGECGPTNQSGSPSSPTAIPSAQPINPADYQGWWTYIHPSYNFSIMLPEDWIVEEITASDPLMNHAINLHPKEIAPDVVVGKENIRMTFRRIGEDVRLWPTGVGQGEFVSQGMLDIAGQPALRMSLVCPTGEVTSIWYHQAEGQPNITRGDLEFGFIFSGTPSHCEAGYSLSGKIQRVGEMIIGSLKVP